ncbi:MAG: S1C family serine protease [bacterium]
MLNVLLPAARKLTTPLFLAVFFANLAAASDSSLAALESSLSSLIYDASNSVVTVEASRNVRGVPFSAGAGESVQQLISSGVVVDTGGYIVTAASSVAGFDHIFINYLANLIPARLVAIDYQTGLALLRSDHPAGVPAELSHQHGCAGQMVVAIGNSLGVRACPSLGFCAGFRPDGLMHFTTTITPGSIGGGVFDLSGRLLGMIVDGVGQGDLAQAAIAVPAHKLPLIVAYLRSRGNRPAGYIGITTADIEVSPGLQINLPYRLANAGASENQLIERATVVTEVVANSFASQAGLLPGDLLFSVNRAAIHSALELMEVVRRQIPGNTIELGLYRQNRPYIIEVRVGQRQLAPPGRFSGAADVDWSGQTNEDSLRRELQTLRQAIDAIEKRLK